MAVIPQDDPIAAAAVAAIRTGDLATLTTLLDRHPPLATAYVGHDPVTVPDGTARTLLHIATDWPGHLPGCAGTVRALAAAGADLDAPFVGPHQETPLHWAASNDDLDALDALLDAGADIDAPGAVLGGGTPLDDAVGFANWAAARRLVERGAATGLHHAAALGLIHLLRMRCAADPAPALEELDLALWYAGHGGQAQAAEHLIALGADAGWTAPWDGSTAVDAARRNGHVALAARLGTR